MSRFGFRPSPDDPRDWPLARLGVDLGAALPLEVSYDDRIAVVYDQSGQTCVGESTARAWNLRAILQGNPGAIYPDPEAIYALAYALELGDPNLPINDDGAVPRCALEAVDDCGVVARGAWAGMRRVRPAWRTMRASVDRRRIRYARLSTALEARQALAAGYPVKDGGDVDESYAEWTTGIYPGLTGPVLGGHDRCLIGYGPGYFLEINSWGPDDAVNGRRMLSDAAVEQCELWAMELVDP